MKSITIKRLRLTNFKGIRSLEINFNEQKTIISGRNGSGKTTIMDAFTWLLFGKDSADRTRFDIKTLDATGKPLPKLPHEVEATLIVDGETLTLCRRYNEKWRKQRGTNIEEFVGHEEARLFNNVAITTKEWGIRIDRICPENVFKFITNPAYFSAQKAETQRNMLFSMAQTVSDDELASGNDDFIYLLQRLNTKPLEQYFKELRATIARTKQEAASIPERIDERQREVATLQYDSTIDERAIKKLKANVSLFSGNISGMAALAQSKVRDRQQRIKKLNELQEELLEVKAKHERKDIERYNEKVNSWYARRAQFERAELTVKDFESKIKALEERVNECTTRRLEFVEQWNEINGRQIEISDDIRFCPTCKQELDADTIAIKRAEMIRNFNATKAEDLKQNTILGRKNNEVKAEYETQIRKLKTDLAAFKLSSNYDPAIADMVKAEPSPFRPTDVTDTEEYIEVQKNIVETEAWLDSHPYTDPDDSEMRQKLEAAQELYQDALLKQANNETINRNKERIQELEAQHRELMDNIAEMEREEMICTSFKRAKIAALENSVNSLFELVRFKMFNTLVNGDTEETCEATVNGVPYSSLNSAARINAGLDIINAICKAQNITAPIFIDNSESVNNILPTQSQQVQLYVSTDETLIIQ